MKKQIAGWRVKALILLLAVSFLIFLFIPNTAAKTETPLKIVTKEIPKPELPQVLKDISWCESRDRQFNPDGSVYRGKINPKDVGQWQINEYWHLASSIKLGIDIYTQAGNEAYALVLYNKNGTRDWNASRTCWENIEAWKAKEKSYY